MITVVDQVRPWFTPSSTFAATTHAHVGAQDDHQRDRHADKPARHENRLSPDRSASAPAARLVAAFVSPKATTNVSADLNR